ncbi:MAG TPA: nicotinate-nucleotide adenylyltransferase [Anaerolineales bacterium]|jgi:nicotinate-nucleotide adenylyltransferase
MIGVFGGTFDPPHLGHLILADEGRAALGLSQVVWTIAGDPPHKPDEGLTPVGRRIEMVRAALSADPHFNLSLMDVDRPGPHYTVDGLDRLRNENGDQPIAYLMGSDSLRDLPAWYQPDRFVELVDRIGILRRPGVSFDLAALDRQLPGLAGKVVFFDAPLVEIAGRDIRDRVRQGRPYRYFVLPAVADLIDRHSLYLS